MKDGGGGGGGPPGAGDTPTGTGGGGGGGGPPPKPLMCAFGERIGVTKSSMLSLFPSDSSPFGRGAFEAAPIGLEGAGRATPWALPPASGSTSTYSSSSSSKSSNLKSPTTTGLLPYKSRSSRFLANRVLKITTFVVGGEFFVDNVSGKEPILEVGAVAGTGAGEGACTMTRVAAGASGTGEADSVVAATIVARGLTSD